MREEKREQLILSKTYNKSNELINAMGKGTALSQKLFAIGMQHIKVDDTNNVVATIYGTDLRKMFKSSSGSLYEHIEALCDRQIKGATIFDWNLLIKDKENGKLEAHQVVTDASFKNGTLTLRYNNSLTDKIVNLKKGYTVLSLAETLSLKSVYSLRLYEMLKSALDYKSAITKGSGAQVFEYDLTELKLELGIINSGGDNKIKTELEKEYPDYDRVAELVEKTGQTKYKEYKIFNRNVLSKAKEELNKKTSLIIDYEPIKSGRKTVGIRFYVDKKGNEEKVSVNKEINKDEVMDELIEFMLDYFKVREIREIAEAAEYDVDKIKKAYDYMLNYNTTVEVPVAFMIDCVRNEYYANVPKKQIRPKNSFNNFEQRQVDDFAELERKLLDN
ncbi:MULTISPECIES: replication initiation protein [unclassified Butyrivibrio]|uniref:replication initiation protein n=1 Tax=unclassified Butyrivibrio TaxID=2639466 RepID=UPI0008ECF13C|nr:MULTISPECIES: replication initiation protein [unclassified Butyrivibrio]RKM56099.1 RepB family plasmid replication initiator protein [Butyrivibrio sp. XB500-5]SFU94412.1 Initiator Replication protein [Butyrivibrio sp. INlla21]